MKKLNKMRLMLFILLIIFLGVAIYQTVSNINIKKDDNFVADKDSEEEIIEDKIKYPTPNYSTQISEFPWDEDEEFLKAQIDNDTKVLIAGFVGVFEGFSDEELSNIDHASSFISKSVLVPNQIFSQNSTVGPYSLENGYLNGEGYFNGEVVLVLGGGVCNVSTTVYNTAILSNLEIIERYNHSMPVPYVPYGQDAAIVENAKDIKFRNTTDKNLMIWSKLIDNRLYMAFYGSESAPRVKWQHETLNTTKADTVYKVNSELKDDEENVLVAGMDGKVVQSTLEITYKDGTVEYKDMGVSYYNPLNHLIERSR